MAARGDKEAGPSPLTAEQQAAWSHLEQEGTGTQLLQICKQPSLRCHVSQLQDFPDPQAFRQSHRRGAEQRPPDSFLPLQGQLLVCQPSSCPWQKLERGGNRREQRWVKSYSKSGWGNGLRDRATEWLSQAPTPYTCTLPSILDRYVVWR